MLMLQTSEQKSPVPSPAWWQSGWRKSGAPALTWIFHHLFRQPNRKAHAGSLREEAPKLSSEQKPALMALLKKHKIIQSKFLHIDPENLQHYHFCKKVKDRRVKEFIEDFNKTFTSSLYIAYVQGQFSIKSKALAASGIALLKATLNLLAPTDPVETRHVIAEASSVARIFGILGDTNRPLTLAEVKREIGKVSTEELKADIHKLCERKILIETFAEEESERRYFLETRLHEVLLRTVFRYEKEDGSQEYIYQKEADHLTEKRKLYAILQADESFLFVSPGRMDQLEPSVTSVKTLKGDLRVFKSAIPELLGQEKLINGLEEETFEPCLVHRSAQRKYRFEIFNAFALGCLGKKPSDESQTLYRQLRTAFDAGVKFEKPKSVVEFIHEARIVRALTANPTAILIALAKRPQAVAALRSSRLFDEKAINELDDQLHRLILVSSMPCLFYPDDANSLQNFIHFVYDKTDSYAVFQVLLAKKLNLIRTLAMAEASLPLPLQRELPPSLQREIELVYAPLAESKGFIDLANNMRELVCKLAERDAAKKTQEKDAYVETRKKMEAVIDMDLGAARHHLADSAKEIKHAIETDPHHGIESTGVVVANLRYSSRVKEVAALLRKEMISQDEALDLLGIRFVCKTVREAYAIAALLQKILRLAPAELLPAGKKVINDHLLRANERGWKGWRGYFIDPKSAAEKPRVFAIQVLTEKMDKEDKMGETNHWGYKAQRAAGELCRKMKQVCKKQILDPAPLEEYNGDPEHDFYVDRDRARRNIRVFVWPPAEDFSEETFALPENGMVPILRLEKGDTIEDAAASTILGNLLIECYGFAQVYNLSYREDKGAVNIGPYFKGQPRAPRGYQLPNGVLLVFPSADKKLTRAELSDLLGKVKKFRTKLLINASLSPKSVSHLVAEGNSSSLAGKLDSVEKQQEIIKLTGLKDINEVWMAITLGLIDEKTMVKALGIFNPDVKSKALEKSKVEIDIETPDRRGLLGFVLEQVKDSHILQAVSEAIPQSSGVSPGRIRLVLRPKSLPRIKGEQKSSMRSSPDVVQLKAGIERYLTYPLVGEPDATHTTRLQINIINRKNWDLIHRLIDFCLLQRMNILNLNLPDLSSEKDDRVGEIIMELKTASAPTSADIDKFQAELKKMLPKGIRFSLREVS
jgi:hypothetical protein